MHYHQFYSCTLPHHCACPSFHFYSTSCTACTSFPQLLLWMWILWKWIGGSRAVDSLGKGTVTHSPSPPSSLPYQVQGKKFWSEGSLLGSHIQPRVHFWSAQQLMLKEGTGTCQPWNFTLPAVSRLPEPEVVFLLLNSPWWIFCCKNLDSHFGIQASFWHSPAQGQLFCSLIHTEQLPSVCLQSVSH